MFDARKNQTIWGAFFRFLEVVYHATVYNVRKTDKNAIVGLLKSCLQAAIMLVIFYVMLSLLGGKAMAVRGDYFLFLLSGILLFMTHIKSIKAIAGAEGPNSPMMQHAPMNSLVAIFGAALSTLYQQVLSTFVVLTIYHLVMAPVQIEEPVKAFGMFLLAWYSGVGVGWCFLALRPYAPGFINIIMPKKIR